VVFGGLLVLIGCTAPRAEIPIGHWEGAGQVLLAGPAFNDPNDFEVATRRYTTTLDIRREEFDGQPATRVEIMSLHGGLPSHPGNNRTWIVMYLREAQRSGPDAVAYLMVHGGLSFDPNAPVLSEGPIYAHELEASVARMFSGRRSALSNLLDVRSPSEPPAPPEMRATAQRVGGTVVVQVWYASWWTDTFRFEGDRVTKDGLWAEWLSRESPQDQHLRDMTHWSESLRRK
jgi:hypothetical protein